MITALHSGLFAAAALKLPHIDYTSILPELILLGGMLVLLTASSLSPKELPTELYASATAGLGIAALIVSLFLFRDVADRGPFSTIAHAIDIDGFAALSLTLVSCIVIVASFFGAAFLRREGIGGCEYYVLALIASSGAMFMASANDLVLIFVALEILSIPLYVMAGLDQRREASGESAMKYFILGAFSSAVFVYGIALTYGATGSTNLAEIGGFLARNVITANGVLLGGMALMLVGFAFKVAAVPFHMWTPDVYQGAPTAATGFMAAIAKVGGFAALIRVLVSTFPTLRTDWQPIIWVIAAATLVLGAVVAIVQQDLKRMLAYSSINHAGFILLGLQAATARGVSASLYYLFTYSFLVLGSFGVIALVGARGDALHDIADVRGLGRRQPFVAACFAIVLLAQAGAPFTTGFFAKLYVVEAAVAAHSYALAVIAMASAAVATVFYLRVVFVMFGTDDAAVAAAGAPGAPAGSPAPAVLASVAAGSPTGEGGVGASGVLIGRSPTVPATAAAAGMSVPGPDRGSGPAVARVHERSPMDRLGISPWAGTGLVICVGATLFFGFWPQALVDFAHQATLIF